MEVFDEVIQSFIKKESLTPYESLWFYHVDGYQFVNPNASDERIEIITSIYQEIQKTVANFVPCNEKIWDVLFGDWKSIVNRVKVNLIIGYPEPNDATVMKNPQGVSEIILDLGCWEKYYGKCVISEVVHNLLTHELCHVCINERIPDISEAISSEDYITNLDANTFHEGFAHLVSYQDQEMEEVNWKSQQLESVKKDAKNRMLAAIKEDDEAKQKEYLYNAIFGSYYDKYACMAGMLFLADSWRKHGMEGLREIFDQGYVGFARKVLE